jgi:hypothetical protein
MGSKAQIGGGLVGLMFLALGVFEFLQGDNWVVWIILGFFFGGFGAAGRLLKDKDRP